MASEQYTNFVKQTLTDKDLEAALELCAQEPIHIPGSIQPHGYMLVLSKEFDVAKVSANVPVIFGLPLEHIINQPLSKWVDEEKLEELKTIINEGPLNSIRATMLEITLSNKPHVFDAIIHRSSQYFVLELEPHDVEVSTTGPQEFYQGVMDFSVSLQKVTDEKTLFDYVTEKMRSLTGFSRVKLYRFDENWNGTVIAESKKFDMPSYLGLSFPHSDIPKQARALYEKNYLRVIADVNYEAVPIIPNDLSEDGKPLDLSFSVTRSVSPIHLEYLRNINVNATMSISIMQDDVLWGLLVCHHDRPFHVPYPVRMAAELYAHTFSAYFSSLRRANLAKQVEQRQASLRELTASFNSDKSLLETIKEKYDLVLKATNADGVLISLNGKHFTFGLTPELSFTLELIQWIEDNYDGKNFVSNSIMRDASLNISGQSCASGVLAMPVSADMKDYVIWFRQEHTQEILWADRHEKAFSKTSAGLHLTPRASFDRWKEIVRGQSLPWDENDVVIGHNMARLILSKKHEDIMTQKTQHLDAVLNNSSALIYTIDVKENIIAINDSALQAFECKKEIVLGLSVDDFFNNEHAQLAKKNVSKIIAQQRALTFEEDYIFKGKRFRLLTVSFPLYDSNDDIYAVCTMSNDISMLNDIAMLKKAEQELVKSNDELERFAYICSHDMQEPLRMIRSFSEILQNHIADTLKNDPKGQKYFDFIIDGAARGQQLIVDILAYSSVAQSAQQLEEVDMNDLVGVVQETMQVSLKERKGRITHADLPTVRGNKTQLYQLLQNVINNGLKYQKPNAKPHIHVSVNESADHWTFSIKDNGIGMEERHLAKIFDVFHRLHRKDEFSGTGIGLSICKKVVDFHGGKIWVESVKGEGSTFIFTLSKISN